MSRYDGLIIPRSYSEYINKTDAATLQQALQLSGVLSNAVADGDNKAVKSGAVAVAITQAVKALRYTFSYYESGYTGLYKISVPYTNNSNTTPAGSIVINARAGNAYIFSFYAFVNESSAQLAPSAGKVYMLPGDQFRTNMLEPFLKWSVDTDNKRINFLLKKTSGANSRIAMSILSYYQPENYTNDIVIQQVTDLTEWDNAQYTNNIETLTAGNV